MQKLNNISDTGFLVNKTDETGGMRGNHTYISEINTVLEQYFDIITHSIGTILKY